MASENSYAWIGKLGIRVFYDFPLREVTTFNIGGPADVLVAPNNKEQMATAITAMVKKQMPYLVLGSGSNVLASDQGYRGAILYLGSFWENTPQVLKEDQEHVWVEVFCTQSKAYLALWAASRGYSGLEFSAGIPGSMGGAVYMNAGTKWGSYGDVIERVEFFHYSKGFYFQNKDQLGFKYRGHSTGLFSEGTVVATVELKLRKEKDQKNIVKRMDEILTYRGERQPLELPNCGSVFKNPENSEKGAGRLIESCELKGTRIGEAQVSEKHANFILNLGQAKASDVISLISLTQTKVFDKYKIRLEPEVILLGA